MRKPMMTLAVLMLAASAATVTWAQNATLIGGELVAMDQFVHNPGEPGFPEPHYHAASGGSVTALSGETFDDPAPFGEGFGQLIFAPLVAGEGLFRPNEGREVTALTGLSREGTDIGSGLAAGVDGLGPSVINVSFDASVALIMTPLVFFGAAYALPPVSGLPGRTKEKWTDLSLDLLAVLSRHDIGGPLLDRFIAAGGHITVVKGDFKSSTEARYNTDDDAIKVGGNTITPKGNIDHRQSRSVVAVFTHEFWHAYVDQVVNEGYDPLTKRILERAAKRLELRMVKKADDEGRVTSKTKIEPAKTYLDTEEKRLNFIEEYVGKMINEMVADHLRIKRRLDAKEITAKEAHKRWRDSLKRLKGTKIQAYEDADSEEFELQSSPPLSLINHLSNVLGLGFPAPKAKTAATKK